MNISIINLQLSMVTTKFNTFVLLIGKIKKDKKSIPSGFFTWDTNI